MTPSRRSSPPAAARGSPRVAPARRRRDRKPPASGCSSTPTASARAAEKTAFADPLAFLAFCHERAARPACRCRSGRRDEQDAAKAAAALRRAGHVRRRHRPRRRRTRPTSSRFDAELAHREGVRRGRRCARSCSAAGGTRRSRRPTTTTRFAEQAVASLRLAEPVVRRAQGQARRREPQGLPRRRAARRCCRRLGSEYVGVCVDTGNNIALLEDPHGDGRGAGPVRASRVHLKDMGVEESADGFLLAEVPLGEGILDLKGIVAALAEGATRRCGSTWR